VGTEVINGAFIGYDFGELKLENGRERYGIDTNIRHQITTIRIKQSSDSSSRVTKARVERSDDGVRWYGVALISLPDDDNLNTVSFKGSAPSRFWRIRPIEFTGTLSNMPWGIKALDLSDYNETSIDNIEDPLFLENKNRDYAETPINLKGTYDLIDVQTEFSRFGLELPSQQFYIHINFNAAVNKLARPIVIGDILELPSETQYTPSMRPILKYIEVTDVGWSTEGYSPGWQPMVMRIIAQPMIASQETQDIFGGLDPILDVNNVFDIGDGNHPVFQDDSATTQSNVAEAEKNLPERGSSEATDIRYFSQEEVDAVLAIGGTNIAKYGSNQTRLYVEDGLPPNGLPYTEGDQLPTTPNDGDYHRLTYSEVGTEIPPRLFRFSAIKNRWLFVEADRRAQYNSTKPILQEYLTSATRVNNDEIGK
jgi:hypothetical protein